MIDIGFFFALDLRLALLWLVFMFISIYLTDRCGEVFGQSPLLIQCRQRLLFQQQKIVHRPLDGLGS